MVGARIVFFWFFGFCFFLVFGPQNGRAEMHEFNPNTL